MGDWVGVGVGEVLVWVGVGPGDWLGAFGLVEPFGELEGEPDGLLVVTVGLGVGVWVAWARASRWAMHSRDFTRRPITMLRAASSDSAGIVPRTCSE